MNHVNAIALNLMALGLDSLRGLSLGVDSDSDRVCRGPGVALPGETPIEELAKLEL
jgi:hypothetical protein